MLVAARVPGQWLDAVQLMRCATEAEPIVTARLLTVV